MVSFQNLYTPKLLQLKIPARCLFPVTPDNNPASSGFSIGHIMASMVLPTMTVGESPSIESLQSNKRPTTTRLHLKDLLDCTPSLATPSSVTDPSKNPFMSFLNTTRVKEEVQEATESLPVPLTLQQLQTYPEVPTGLRLPVKTPSMSPTTTESPTRVRPTSPTSDLSDVSIDVETTSLSGSTTSSGFHSSPSPSSNSKLTNSSEAKDTETTNQRTAYNKQKTNRLKEVFDKNRYPDVEMYEQLSDELDISIPRLRTWFQNRRARSKKSSPGTKIMTYPPNMAAMMSSPGMMTPSPMMHHPQLQYPGSHPSMFPVYPLNMYPGYSYPYNQQH